MTLSLEPSPLRQDDFGTIRVGRTRVTLDSVIYAHESGSTPEEVVEQYPSLALADVYLVVGYYMRHREEVQAYLAERQAESEESRREYELRDDPTDLRERLLARRAAS